MFLSEIEEFSPINDPLIKEGVNLFMQMQNKEAALMIDLNNKSEIQIYCDESNEKMQKILTSFPYWKSSKKQKPDIICDNKFYNLSIGIEHFDFDASAKMQKSDGSTLKLNQNKVDREFKDFIENGTDNTFSTIVKQEWSYKYYEENLKRIFNYHYSNYDEYLNNLSSEEKMLGFFIRDTTLLGTYINKNSMTLSLPFNYQVFWDLFINSQLDFCIICSDQYDKYYLIFKEDYKYFVENNMLYNIKDIFCLSNPNFLGGAIRKKHL